MSTSESETESGTQSSPESDEETIDRFCIVFIVLPLLPVTHQRWLQIAEERCCNSFGCGKEQFALIRAFAAEIRLTPKEFFCFDRQFICKHLMQDLFDSYFDIPEELYLPLIRIWADCVRCNTFEPKLTSGPPTTPTQSLFKSNSSTCL